MTIRSFLRGEGRDGRGRLLAAILGYDNATLEAVHDYIQWLFPLRQPSRAVPGSPVLGDAEALAIRADPAAQDGLRAAVARMARFYAETDGWLTPFDHNHLRITRILTAVRDLLGDAPAQDFLAHVLALNDQAGSVVNARSIEHWRHALD